MSSGSIAVIVNRSSKHYCDYEMYIKPYLKHFGFPYYETENYPIDDCALVLVGHKEATRSNDVGDHLKDGVRMVCFDSDVLPIELTEDGLQIKTSNLIIEDTGHYITQLHNERETKPFYDYMELGGKQLKNSTTLVTADNFPLVQVYELNNNRIVLFRSIEWASHRVLGPVNGMDDIVWRSIVWAAKKPFVMQGMPPFLGMRVDDVWGAWRDKTPHNPVSWLTSVMDAGIKPWLGLFQDNADEITVSKIREYAKANSVTVFPHAFSGCEWTKSELPEHWIYFDHNNKKPYTDDIMAENMAKVKEWYSNNSIPISKYAVGHYYETGANAIKTYLDFGCEFIGIHMQPDTPYGSDNWVMAGPYRNYEKGKIDSLRPVYYEDYLSVEKAPEYSDKLFNCVTEIRDITGYEWHPITNTEETIKRGIAHLQRAYDSMVVGVLFTHESRWIQRLTPQMWDTSIKAIVEGVKEYNPMFMTMDEICAYARAKHNIYISDIDIYEDKLSLKFVGSNDQETKCYLFNEVNGKICQKLIDVPQISNEQFVSYNY